LPYHVTCDSCGLLLYSAAPIRERVCQRCGAGLPEPEAGSPPVTDEDEGEGARVGAEGTLEGAPRSPFRPRSIDPD